MVELINVIHHYAVVSWGRQEAIILPITNWYDLDGDACEPCDAVACTAGHEGIWLSVSISSEDVIKRDLPHGLD